MRRELVNHPGYAAVKAAFPAMKLDGGGMTPAQGRLCFHQERLLFGRRNLHAIYLTECKARGIPSAIEEMPAAVCKAALRCLEDIARRYPVIGRDHRTQWETTPCAVYSK